MHWGPFEVRSVRGGTLREDGGAMFGLVPKPLWEQSAPPDERNRIPMRCNCLLVRTPGPTILIDTGYGAMLSEKERAIHAAEVEPPLLADLAGLGLSPDAIDRVVLTHLHFDHAGGGVTRTAGDRITTVFRRARYVVQRGEWEDAAGGDPDLRAAYPPHCVLPLAASGQLDLIDGEVEIYPGIRCIVTGGHTRAHQAIALDADGERAVYLGDFCPTTAHTRIAYGMGYDLFPLELRRAKRRLFREASERRWLVFWDHDPHVLGGRIAGTSKGDFEAVETFADF